MVTVFGGHGDNAEDSLTAAYHNKTLELFCDATGQRMIPRESDWHQSSSRVGDDSHRSWPLARPFWDAWEPPDDQIIRLEFKIKGVMEGDGCIILLILYVGSHTCSFFTAHPVFLRHTFPVIFALIYNCPSTSHQLRELIWTP
ncbi:hypothetical protein NC653_024847 [Populus alba x Populus x berolinensis]|uniref:Uncharacterized protein n=1 Tax=Populus alba x Populus x berolinensis TaxID=444605 RepID=A0AAD6Q8B9_9ROSI|nr:hypothetical protein NC653_024847 [Populus alba x Populus x berolinensis]